MDEKINGSAALNIDLDGFEKFTTIMKGTMDECFKVDPEKTNSKRKKETVFERKEKTVLD